MKAYLAIAYLNRREWAADTVCASLRYGFELCLRKHLQDEGGEVIAAHALFLSATPVWHATSHGTSTHRPTHNRRLLR